MKSIDQPRPGSRWASVLALALFPAMPAQAGLEEQVSALPLPGFEFDSARDGVYCPTCNFGAGNSRVSFVDAQFRLWVAKVDYATGKVVMSGGNLQLVDTGAAPANAFGNAAGWVFSQRGSELVYTRYLDGQPRDAAHIGIAYARMTGPGAWSASFLPGAYGRVNPEGTQNPGDAVPSLSYGDVFRPQSYWRRAVAGATEQLLPGDGSNRGLGLRWMPSSTRIVFSELDALDPGIQQMYVHDTATGATEQITSGPGQKSAQFLVAAPELGGDDLFVTLVDGTRFDLYRRLTDGQGQLRWTLVHTVWPPADRPYIAGSPEVFVYNGRTWMTCTLRDDPVPIGPTSIAITSLDAARPEWRLLTDESAPARWRTDPEHFINDQGVFVYYSRFRLDPMLGDGVWRIDTGLGPPERHGSRRAAR